MFSGVLLVVYLRANRATRTRTNYGRVVRVLLYARATSMQVPVAMVKNPPQGLVLDDHQARKEEVTDIHAVLLSSSCTVSLSASKTTTVRLSIFGCSRKCRQCHLNRICRRTRKQFPVQRANRKQSIVSGMGTRGYRVSIYDVSTAVYCRKCMLLQPL